MNREINQGIFSKGCSVNLPPVLLAITLLFSANSYDSKASTATAYCEKAMQIESSRMKSAIGIPAIDIKSACSNSEHTSIQWECIVHSMTKNEYSMSQALNDCDGFN